MKTIICIRVGKVLIGKIERTGAVWQPISGYHETTYLKCCASKEEATHALLAAYAEAIGPTLAKNGHRFRATNS